MNEGTQASYEIHLYVVWHTTYLEGLPGRAVRSHVRIDGDGEESPSNVVITNNSHQPCILAEPPSPSA